MIQLIGVGVNGAVRWLWNAARMSWEVPPVPLWLVAILALAFLLAYRVGRRRGRALIGRILDPKPWSAREAVQDGQFLLDGEHQRVLDALAGEAAGAAASSVAALTNLAWDSVRQVAAELEGGGYVAVRRYHLSGDWLLGLTPAGERALREVSTAGRRRRARSPAAAAGPATQAPSTAAARSLPAPGAPPAAGGPHSW
jgi:hypothetical protein